MKKISKMKLSGFIVLSAIATCFAFILPQTDKWTAAPGADKKINPVTSNEQSIAAGKAIYIKNCNDCHGKKGKGDGPKSGDLEKSPRDFTKEDFQKQTDGTIFWKVTEGKKPMPSFKKDLSEEQRWQVINYVRRLGIKK